MTEQERRLASQTLPRPDSADMRRLYLMKLEERIIAAHEEESCSNTQNKSTK